MDHIYKGFVLKRSGTREYPWNIYRMDYDKILKKTVMTHVGFERTLKECRTAVDSGLCIDEI